MMPATGRPPESSRSVSAALDAIMLDESWQGNLTDEERALLVEWAERHLSEILAQSVQAVRARLHTCNHLMPLADSTPGRRKVIKAIIQESS